MKKKLHTLFVSLTMLTCIVHASLAAPPADKPIGCRVCDDAHEYNDVMDSATAIATGTVVYGRIDSVNDVDWYKFTLTNPGSIAIWVDNLPAIEENPDEYLLELWSPNGTYMLVNQYEYELATLHLYYYGAAPGTYYARIYRGGQDLLTSATDCYHLTVNTQQAPNSCSESYEPNNDFYNPVSIPLNTEILAQLSYGGDIDYYRLQTDEPHSGITITLRNAMPEFEMVLWSDSLNGYTEFGRASTNYLKDSAVINFPYPIPGSCHLEIMGWGNAYSNERCYSLIVQTYGDGSRKPVQATLQKTATPVKRSRVYPVPTQGTVYLELQSKENKTRYVTVADMNGRIVYSKLFRIVQGSNRLEIDMPAALKSGMYILSDGEEAQRVILHR